MRAPLGERKKLLSITTHVRKEMEMRHLHIAGLLLMVFTVTGCDWYWGGDDDDSADPGWPESQVTEAEIESLAGDYNCTFTAGGSTDIALMEECLGQFQGSSGTFGFHISRRNLTENKVGGLSELRDGSFYDNTFEDWYCPGYDAMGDLSACGGAYEGKFDVELTVYEDDFAGHDVWTDGVTGMHILHGWLVDSSRMVVIEAYASSGNWTVYLRDDSNDDYHNLWQHDHPSDFDWTDTITCTRSSTNVADESVEVENCSFSGLDSGDWGYILGTY